MTRVRLAGATLTLLLVSVASGVAARSLSAVQRPTGGQRVGPPARVECPRDHLTVYTGRVTAFTRTRDRTEMRIRTDWDTTERVALTHTGSDDPAPWFLLGGKPFVAADWPRIESSRGRLRPETRASAWVCDDGRNAVVDWNPASEPPPPYFP